jgi:putative flavoprotein involved in K+ transport
VEKDTTEHPGLYFLSLPWLHTPKSGLLFGVGDDARYLAGHIRQRPRA